jgi:outer membrane protein OmpA-like peptidoglycan-associated protein
MFILRKIILFILCCTIGVLSAQDEDLKRFEEVIYFETGSSDIKAKYENVFYSIRSFLNQKASLRVKIHAHTDSIGSAVSNDLLSANRAYSVRDALYKIGVRRNQISIRTHGSSAPSATNRTESGRAMNRRVTITALGARRSDAADCTLKGRVIDKENLRGVQARLVFNYLGGCDTLVTDKEGYYTYELSAATNVEIRVYAKGYFYEAKIAKTKNKEETIADFLLNATVVGRKMALKNLYFKGGTPILLEESEKSLRYLVEYLLYNTTIKLEIGGHINKPGVPNVEEVSRSYLLSAARAMAVYTYLIENGVETERLTFKGYGNWEMLHVKPSSEQEKQANRRVELKVVE